MRVLFIALLACMPLSSLFSNPDSLFNAWQNEQLQPDERAEALHIFLKRGFIFQNPDSSLVLLNSLEKLAQANKLASVDAALNRDRGVCWAVKGDNQQAMEFFSLAKDKFEKVGDEKMAARSYANVASIYVQMGNFDEALAIYHEIIEKPIMEDESIAQLVYSNIGTTYQYKKNFKKSIYYLDKSYNYFTEASNPINKSIVLGNIASNYYDLGEYDISEKKVRQAIEFKPGANAEITLYSKLGTIYLQHQKDTAKALEYLEISKKLIEDNQLYQNAPTTYQEIAQIYFGKGELEKSEKYANQAIEILGEESINIGKMEMLTLIGKIRVAEGQLAKAKDFCNRSLKLADNQNLYHQSSGACECLMNVAKKEGDFKTAFNYSTRSNELFVKATENENNKEITTLALNYEFENEKKLIALEQKQKEDLLIAENKQSRNAAMGFGAFGLLALCFFFNARRQNQLISAQKDELESLNDIKDRIFAIIGHDLRKPAASFRGISKKVKYLIKKQDFDTLDQLGGHLEQNALSLNKLTDNLLNWALMQRDVMPYNPQKVSIGDIAADIQTIFETPAGEKNITINNQVPADMLVYADPTALSTIMTNLVDNAIKYTLEGGQVNLTAFEENGKQVKIRVSDTGIGMEKDKMNDLFLLKKDKSEKGTSGEKGTGLGLHLVKELVELNKGVISAISDLGKGTSIEVMLPRMQVQAA
jgi:pentatricopeptide repeat protein